MKPTRPFHQTPVITIDGPSASGKGTVAALVAAPADIVAAAASKANPKASPFSAGPVVSVASAGQDSAADTFGELKKRGHKIKTDILV